MANQVEFIAEDKPYAARKFKNDVIQAIKELKNLPYKHHKSIYLSIQISEI